jgi:hypothetical protein
VILTFTFGLILLTEPQLGENMKKLMLMTVAVIGLSFGAFADEPPANAANSPNASGPKHTRQEMRKKIHEENKEKIQAMQAKIKEACSADIATAGCTGKEGGEMMQCMRTYKESHKDFKASEGCREVMGERREMRHEMREEMHDKMGQMRHDHMMNMGGAASGTSTTTPAGH